MDRFITMIFRGDEDVVTSIAEQIASGQADGKIIMSGDGCQLLGAWATDTNPAAEQDHLLQLEGDGWVIQHTWDCRLRGQLLTCPYNAAASGLHALAAMTRVVATRGEGLYVAELAENGRLVIGAKRS